MTLYVYTVLFTFVQFFFNKYVQNDILRISGIVLLTGFFITYLLKYYSTKKKKCPSYIGISGLIGLGKTHLAESLAEYLGYDIQYEPVKENPFLERFYKDPKTWAFQLETYFLEARSRLHREMMKTGKNCVQDRSIWDDIVFAKMLYDSGKMDLAQYNTYIKLFEQIVESLEPNQVIIHLRGSPEIALQRIKKRGRACETGITLEYLQDLNTHYNDWIINEINHRKGIRVVEIDWTEFKSAEYVVRLIKHLIDSPEESKNYITKFEANIAAGKSFAVEEVSKIIGPDKIQIYQEFMPKPLLNLFKSDMKRYALAVQNFAIWYRTSVNYSIDWRNALIDRGLFGDSVFLICNKLIGNCSDSEFEVYLSAVRHPLVQNAFWNPRGRTIFLNVSLKHCVSSLKKRGNVDKDTPINYLTVLHLTHLYGILWMKCRTTEIVHVLDPPEKDGYVSMDDIHKILLKKSYSQRTERNKKAIVIEEMTNIFSENGIRYNYQDPDYLQAEVSRIADNVGSIKFMPPDSGSDSFREGKSFGESVWRNLDLIWGRT